MITLMVTSGLILSVTLIPTPIPIFLMSLGDYCHRVVVQSAAYFRRTSDHPLII
jgi:hypothetical protein